MDKIGFDSKEYTRLQSERITERIRQFGGKLYLEFGGKLFDDHHAARVLPGFLPDSKIEMLKRLKDDAEIVIVINANDIIKNKLRADLGITYDHDVLRLIDEFRTNGLTVGSVVVAQYAEKSPAVEIFCEKLQNLGLRVYKHFIIDGYPDNVSHVVSDEGFGKNEYIETEKRLIVVTAPGPGSGKMATCLSQLYHDYKRGIKAGYAKYETFPVWNLSIDHPVNLAYEAATADLNDVNKMDVRHSEAYGVDAVNYNRDIESFPVLKALFIKLTGKSPYRSPTDMGVNMAGFAITDDAVCREAAKQEVIRRYFKAIVFLRKGCGNQREVDKITAIMDKLGIKETDRPVASAARACELKKGTESAAIELRDGRIVTGKTTDLLGCSCSALLNALKTLANIDDRVNLVSPQVIEPIQRLKTEFLGGQNPRLHTDEVLIALSISAATEPLAERALHCLADLKGCDAHTTRILSPVDETVFRKLGCNVTSDPVYSTKKLFH